MKIAISYQKTPRAPMTDVSIPRCPDVQSFHFSLDRLFGENYEFTGESHPFYELVYVLSGSAGVTAGEKVYLLNAGQCLIHLPNEFHRIWSERGSEPHILNLSFHASSIPESNRRVLEPSSPLRDEFTEIVLEVRDGLYNEDLSLLNAQRLRFENWLLHATKESLAVDPEPPESTGASRYAEIVRAMQEHLGENLSAEEIAYLCHMSLSNLKKIFTKYAGMGVSRYFTEMKMRRAAELLRSGRRVREVAGDLGYADQNYFNTVFHRIMGVSPGKYRDGSV